MSKKNQSRVSVYIPTRNRVELLKRAVASVFEQTRLADEIVVVDDASDDDTPKYLAEIAKDHPVKVIRNTTPKGAAASRNIAIEHTEAKFVAGLDDDDFWRPKRIEILLDAFEDGFSAVCSNDRMDFGNKEIVWKKKRVITYDDLLYYNQVGNQVLSKKEYIQAAGGYDETLPAAQDYDLWIRLVHDFGPVKTVPHTLQVVNMRQDHPRITTSGSRAGGYRACFEKHQAKMNPEQRKYQLYRMKMDSDQPPSWLDLFRSVPSHLLVKEFTRKLFL